MAHIVVLGAGLGGMPMAYEMKEQLRPGDRVTVVGNGPNFHFVPSNPWVAVSWRKRSDIEFPAAPYLEKKGIAYDPRGAKRLHPEKNQLELSDGAMLDYDFIVIATGPKLAFDEVEGLGPTAHTNSICHVDHAEKAAGVWDGFVKEPGAIVVGAVQGASCFGPAYEFAFIMDKDLRTRKIRDRVPMTFVTAEPYIGHLGLGGVGDSKTILLSAMRSITACDAFSSFIAAALSPVAIALRTFLTAVRSVERRPAFRLLVAAAWRARLRAWALLAMGRNPRVLELRKKTKHNSSLPQGAQDSPASSAPDRMSTTRLPSSSPPTDENAPSGARASRDPRR